MKRLILLINILITSAVYAQQDPLYGLQNNIPLLVNPAYAGMHNHASANMNYRSQWSGFEGAPSTVAFSGFSRLGGHPAGAGFNIVHDKYGVNSNTEIQLDYGYAIQAGKGKIIFGLQGSFMNVRADYTSLTLRDQEEIFGQNVSEWMPNFGTGVIFTTPGFFAGFSIPRILNSKLNVGDIEIDYYHRHYYLTLAGALHLSENVVFRPWGLLRSTEGLDLSYDIRTDFVYNDFISAGLLTRSFNTYGFALSFISNNKFRIMYQFEMPTSGTPDRRFNSHEIGIGFDFTLFEGHNLTPKYF